MKRIAEKKNSTATARYTGIRSRRGRRKGKLSTERRAEGGRYGRRAGKRKGETGADSHRCGCALIEARA